MGRLGFAQLTGEIDRKKISQKTLRDGTIWNNQA